MTTKDLVDESVAHYDRMIAWVTGKIERSAPYHNHIYVVKIDMLGYIEEIWNEVYCPLCKEYLNDGCAGCPYSEKYGICPDRDSQNSWWHINLSKSWVELKSALEAVRDQLQSLEVE